MRSFNFEDIPSIVRDPEPSYGRITDEGIGTIMPVKTRKNSLAMLLNEAMKTMK